MGEEGSAQPEEVYLHTVMGYLHTVTGTGQQVETDLGLERRKIKVL